MTAEDFIRALKEVVYKGAVEGTVALLERPPGRQPRPEDVELSHWFNSLEAEDREQVARVARNAASQATYILLLILDGLLAFEPVGSKGALELYYRASDGRSRVRLNDENAHQLTDLFKNLD